MQNLWNICTQNNCYFHYLFQQHIIFIIPTNGWETWSKIVTCEEMESSSKIRWKVQPCDLRSITGRPSKFKQLILEVENNINHQKKSRGKLKPWFRELQEWLREVLRTTYKIYRKYRTPILKIKLNEYIITYENNRIYEKDMKKLKINQNNCQAGTTSSNTREYKMWSSEVQKSHQTENSRQQIRGVAHPWRQRCRCNIYWTSNQFLKKNHATFYLRCANVPHRKYTHVWSWQYNCY
jgi:hypothetical protein